MIMTVRQKIDVEQLVIWTYQRQKADIVVDRGVGLHDLERQAAGITVIHNTTDGSGSGIAVLGCRVDCGGTPSGDLHPDAEAVHDAVRRAPSRLWRSLLIEMGRTGRRPDWMPGARIERRVVLNSRGRPKMIYDDSRHPIGPKIEPMVVVDRQDDRGRWSTIPVGSPENLTMMRRMWAEWRAALVWLADDLAAGGMLESHDPQHPAVPMMPWQEN